MNSDEMDKMAGKIAEVMKGIASEETVNHAMSILLFITVAMMKTRTTGTIRSVEDFLDGLQALGDAVKIARMEPKKVH